MIFTDLHFCYFSRNVYPTPMDQYRKLNIKSWAVEDRPREKLMSKGSRALSDAELLAILLGSGNPRETAVELGRRILEAAGNSLAELGRKPVGYFTRFNGIGNAKAISIVAAMELGRRRRDIHQPEAAQISSSHDAASILTPLIADLGHEEFWVILLNRNNRVIHTFMTSSGGITATVIDVRTILKTAIDQGATSMIVGHNHPSGNLAPSEADIQITAKLREAAKIMDIAVLDHIIIAQKGYYSFADNGLM